jgi:hypothetical protein
MADDHYDAPPTALEVVQTVLLVPSQSVVETRLAERRCCISELFSDPETLGEVIDIWATANPELGKYRRFILAVDAVSFRNFQVLGLAFDNDNCSPEKSWRSL